MPPVAFPAADLNTYAVTPHRKTKVTFNLPDYRRLRQHWGQNLIGPHLAELSGAPGGKNQNVRVLPSGSWCIASWEMQMQFEREECSGNLILAPGATSAVDFAPGFQRFASQSKIPGVTYDTGGAGIVTIGSYFCRKRRDASADWHAELTADVAAIPKPPQLTQNVPMRRVAHHTGTLSPNQPVYLRFYGPGAPLATTDALINFYFGGDVSTSWPDPTDTTAGGHFCLSLYGDGSTLLWEHTLPASPNPWRPVDFNWEWSPKGLIANRQHVICILPEGKNILNFVGGTTTDHLTELTSLNAGYTVKQATTGVGSLRLDMREDLRSPFQFGNLSFPVGGLDSGPYPVSIWSRIFNIPFRLAVGAKIFPDADLVPLPGGGGLTTKIYNAKTKTALAGPAGDGSFATATASQRAYYAEFILARGGGLDGFTPFLRGCNFRVDGVTQLDTPTPYSADRVMEVAITGPDHAMADAETANLLVEDIDGSLGAGPEGLGGLDSHAEMRTQVTTSYDKDDPTKQWVLFDGYLERAPALRAGREDGRPAWVDLAHPSPPATASKWKTYHLQMAGQWKRLAPRWQVLWQAKTWAKDPSGALDAHGDPAPWQIIDIIKELLRAAGYDDSQIQLKNPDGTTGPNGPRLYANAKSPQDYYLLPGASIVEAVEHFCSDYLRGRLLWDGAAPPHGRWIMVYPPALSGTYASVYTFRTQSNLTNGVPIHMPQAWPTGTTFVSNYTTWVTPPEGNLFIVITGEAAGPTPNPQPGGASPYVGKSGTLILAVGVNWRSTDFTAAGYPAPDPASPDWVPYGIKPVVIPRPDAWNGNVEDTNTAAVFLCRQAMNAGAYGLKWFQWLSPLMPYFDPAPVYAGGPRLLRPYDIVEFNADGALYNVALTSVNPQIGLPEGDLCQWAQYEGYVLPQPLSY